MVTVTVQEQRLPSPEAPLVEIKTKRHVALSSESWKLVGRCKAYNSSYIIKQCQWRQVHPRTKTPEKTVFDNETRNCSLPTTPSHDIDATVDKLKVPTFHSTYIFELTCSDDTGNANADDVEISVKELSKPKITVAQEDIIVSSSVGHVKLNGSCQAVQGHIDKEEWIYLDGPEAVTPTANGSVDKLFKTGIYKFTYKCTDSYNMHETKR